MYAVLIEVDVAGVEPEAGLKACANKSSPPSPSSRGFSLVRG
jgi:hypothetical protein